MMMSRNNDKDAPIVTGYNDKPLVDDIFDVYAKGNEDNDCTKDVDNNKYAKGDNNGKHAKGNDNNKYTKGDKDNKPLGDNDDDKYAEGGVVEDHRPCRNSTMGGNTIWMAAAITMNGGSIRRPNMFTDKHI